jgi:hypothetical protein
MLPLIATIKRIESRDRFMAGKLKVCYANDEQISYAQLLECLGLDDTLWCCWLCLDDTLWCYPSRPNLAPNWRRFAVWCAKQVKYLMTDQRSLNALDVAERYVNGAATDDELCAAHGAATAAEYKADTAVVAVSAVREPFAYGKVVAAAWAASVAADVVAVPSVAFHYVAKCCLYAVWNAAYANAGFCGVSDAHAALAGNDAKAAVKIQQAEAFRQLVTTGQID